MVESGRWMVLLTVLLAGLVGCGRSDQKGGGPTASGDSGTQAIANAQQNPGVKNVAPPGNGPEAAVFEFMEAVRTGNDAKAGQMLTPLARQKVAEHHMVVAPPGTDTARFEIGEVQRLAEDGARVVVKWTDLNENGQPHTDEVLWMVRLVPEGWRIAGVAAPVFEGEAPLLLNFEDPEDMLQKQRMVHEEIRRRAEQGNSQPPQTANSENSIQR